MEARCHVIISGNLRGSFLRSSIRSQAVMRRVAGWAKHTPEGGIEALFEGEKDEIEAILDYCRDSPNGAAVSDIMVEWEEGSPSLEGFEIR
ncbi:MAG: acylphosphatase [Candidatus Aenigmarchaeota archaeon]|nr:acylphosphatase [Candidatus Aenigmarchaeota archaeon]